ncbi:hypothetical protein H8B08_14490, partial [Caulobacter sp. 17J80-11]|nr:hypothetical protein [Caulobacter sp. 17J80-11]
MRKTPWVFLLALVVLGLASASAFAAQPYGRIGEKYAALGAAAGPLGAPIGDEAEAAYGGRRHLFKEGVIYWHPRIGEAYAVWGAIGRKHWELGGVAYGYPITDERATPDGRGRYNHFRAVQAAGAPESSIYWTPQTGAHAVYGLIRDAWARGGWERGALGYPTSDEFQDGKYRRSNFERGYILWAPDTGVKVVAWGYDTPTPRADPGAPRPTPPVENPAALNPQPLPPVDSPNPAALNPQPLPPVDNPAALNPQPLPPVD